jgi:hypothetical protein
MNCRTTTCTSLAAFTGYGSGCRGSAGIPTLFNVGLPVLGQSFSVNVTATPANGLALLLTGFSKTQWGAINLPFDLSGVGAPGCSVLASGDVIDAVATNALGIGTWQFSVPNSASLCGGSVFHQYLVADSTANNLGFTTTSAAESKLGQ